MLAQRLNAVRLRLDALREGRVHDQGFLSRARGFLDRSAEVDLEVLRSLDRAFDLAGIHTSADARLLRDLGRLKGRVAAVSEGLSERTDHALAQLELAVRRAERLFSVQHLPPGLLTELELDFIRASRAVKVVGLFTATDVAEVEDEGVFARPVGPLPAPPSSARLAIAEKWADRARDNVDDVLQKRRDLDLAHELLLRVGALPAADRERLRKARLAVADARERVKQVPVTRNLHDLVRHVRQVARRDPGTAYRSLRGLFERAVEANDGALATVAREASVSLLPEGEALKSVIERGDLKRSIGWREPSTEEREALKAERVVPGGKRGPADTADETLAQLAYELDERLLPSLELATSVARYFDVEDALSDPIVEAQLSTVQPVQRRVSYPTQQMTYEFTNQLSELSNFVINHPSTLVFDLASNQQMVRAYLEEETPPQKRKMKKTAVRVYVLDASGSMHGPRARFRDAVLIAELNSIRVKGKQGVPFDPLYFSFFNDSPTELKRVDSAGEAMRHIDKLFNASPAEGQTDITLALMSAFDSIRAAQGKDPYLARATVVLVTDGEDSVDLELIRRTRQPFEGLDIALSFISLGEENPDLRSLVREQQKQGSRAFYHHLSDTEIGLAPTEFDSGFRTLLPVEIPATPNALELLLPHLEALEAVARGRPSTVAVSSAAQFEALFPNQPVASSTPAEPATVLRVSDILEAVTEAGSLASADQRAGEAVVLVNHLLKLYAISMPRYADALSSPEPRRALERLRLVCKPY